LQEGTPGNSRLFPIEFISGSRDEKLVNGRLTMEELQVELIYVQNEDEHNWSMLYNMKKTDILNY